MNTDTQEMRDFIATLTRERGKTLKELSHLIGKGDTYMHDYVRKGVPRRLYPDDAAKIATALGVSVDEMYAARPLPQPPVTSNQFSNLNSTPTGARVTGSSGWVARDVPILGGVKGGKEGVFMNDGTVFGWADRPPSLAGVPDAYYVDVFGESMHPMYKHGEGVWVNPNAPLVKGKGVVVVLAAAEDGDDMEFYIKEFVRRTSSHLVCKQYNPEQEVKYPLARVSRSDRIVARNEA